MGGCGECLAKFGLISFNILFLLSGIGVLGVGIWLKVDKNVVNMQHLVEFDSKDKQLDIAANILIGFGSFVLLVSALGFFAACTQKKIFIGFYIAFLVLIFAGEFAGGITAAVFKGKIEDELPKILSKTFSQYTPGKNLLAKAWDYMQVWLKCCGSTGFKDYQHVNFTKPTQHVPLTCCKLSNKDPENPKPLDSNKCLEEATIPSSQNNTFMYLQGEGCYSSLEDAIKSHLGLIIGVGVGIAMIQLLGIVLACCVCRRDKDNDIY